MKTTTAGRAFAKNIFDLFSTLMISLPIENHKIFLRSYPNSFTAEEAISNLGGLKFIQANHDADPNDPTRIITRVVTTQFSLSRDMAKNLCQTFMDARLFESASDQTKREFQNKGVHHITGKGAHIVEKFVHRNSLSIEETRHITANATPRILFLERTEDEDAIVLNQKAIDVIFKRFAGQRPNVIRSSDSSNGDTSPLTSSPGRDRVQANIDRCNGIEVKDQQHNYDMYKHTFYGKAALEWLLDYTSVISKEEAACIAQEMVNARYIEQVGEDNKNGQALFKTGNSALYHFTELGRAVIGWESLIRSRGSSVNIDWMDERSPASTKPGRANPELLLSTQFKLTSKTTPRLPISVVREKRRSADESSLGGSTTYNEESSSNNNGTIRRLSQILNDPAFQILSEPGSLSSYTPSSSGKESVGQREGGVGGGSVVNSSSQSTTSNATRLNLILSNSTLREMFRAFLKHNICEENLAFYLEVVDYRNKFNTLINSTRPNAQSLSGRQDPSGPVSATSAASVNRKGLAVNTPNPSSLRELEKKICTQAFAIHETYLVSGSPRELNLPHHMRHDITAYMQAVVRNMETSPPSSKSSSTTTSEALATKSPTLSPLASSPQQEQGGEDGEMTTNGGTQRELIHISLFDRIHEHIFRLMSTDSVPKFTKTDKYREVMMNRVRQRDSRPNSNGSHIGSTFTSNGGLRSPPLSGPRNK